MELLLIRHAIAFARDPRRWSDDETRPLSPLGIKRSRKAALGLTELCEAPDRLFTSPLARARQTAKILTEVAGWPRAEVRPELKPGTPASNVLARLDKERSKRIAIVGHQPDLSVLLTACLLEDNGALPIDIKKNAVACLSFSGKARGGSAILKWLATPRMLRGLRTHRGG